MAEEPKGQFTGELTRLSTRLHSVEITKRQREVMTLLMSGLTNKEAAKILGISPRTCEVHRMNALKKFGVRNLVELVAYDLVDSKTLVPVKMPIQALDTLSTQLKQMQKTLERIMKEQRAG